jgi:molybdate transport system substrate-binding protein
VRRELFILSAGAAKAVVQRLQPEAEREERAVLRPTFGAVGAMRDLWAAGAPCDVLILSAKLLENLAHEGAIDPATRSSLGHVRTGIAIRAGSAVPALANADQLRETLLAASALYLPDPERATAGIHCVAVLRRLDIITSMQSRLRSFENGAAAMRELAASADERAIGCTQVTEILYTPGVVLAGSLPPGFELNTEYAAAVVRSAREPELARRFIERLAGEGTLAARRAGGFDV